MAKQSKMKNKKVEHDGIEFDSIAEGDYYLLLKRMKDICQIQDFKIQPKFVLQNKFTSRQFGNIRSIVYKADFEVKRDDGTTKIIDVKGRATPLALLKRKMFLVRYDYLDLSWVVKSKKHGGKSGWIDYFELDLIRSKAKKEKKKKEEALRKKANSSI